MPDPTKHSISATQASALWNHSPYVTRWMLWQHFANGMSIEPPLIDDRIREGKRMQPLVLERAADEMRLQIIPNDESYVRNGRIGCTRDAVVICPDRGPGALETKCVFDYRTWMTDFGGGEFVPRHMEIQLQVQMAVGDGHAPYAWGVLAVWVAASQFYFERKPMLDLWRDLVPEADRFFDDVAERREPDPFGSPVELPYLEAIYPTVEGSVLDLREVDDAEFYVEKARTFLHAKSIANDHKKIADAYRADFIATLKGKQTALLVGGAAIRMGKRNRLSVYVPGFEGSDLDGE